MIDLDAALAQANTGDTIVVEGETHAVLTALAHAASTLRDRDPLIIVPNRVFQTSLSEAIAAEGFDTPRMLTAYELSESVLRKCDTKAPRVMLPFEEELLIEDLKVSGIKPRRIKEMVKFFMRSLSELSNRDPNWLVTEEERLLFTLLDNHLASRGIAHANQLGGMALAALGSHGSIDGFSERALIVAGYTALDAATQELICALQPELLIAGGSDQDCGLPQFPYFNPSGLQKLRDAGASYVCVEDGARPQGSVVRAANASEEAKSVAQMVARWIKDGIAANQILVEIPNGAWLGLAKAELDAAGIPNEVLRPLHMDKTASDDATTSTVGAFAALGIIADSSDVNAWRTWFALGDWLGNSAAWAALQKTSPERKQPLRDTIAALLEGNVLASLGKEQERALARLNEPLTRGKAVIEAMQGKTGAQLTDSLATITSRETAHALHIAEDETAADVYKRIRIEAIDPAPQGHDAVRIAVHGSSIGLSARAVCHVGTLEGVLPEPAACDYMTPPVKRERLLTENRRTFKASTQHGAAQVVFTWPETMGVEEASRSRLFIERIYAEGGHRKAHLARSRFLNELFHA